MRVAIEAATLSLPMGGLARYATELSRALSLTFPEDDYWLISNQPFELPTGAGPNLRKGGGPRGALERRWWLWGCGREAARLGADVVHGPDFSVPYLPLRPSVLTLHDLSPWMNAAWHFNAGRVARRTPPLLRFGIATMVLTPSEATRRQAIEHFGLHPDRVIAAPEAAAGWFAPVETNPTAPYFLYVGALEPRKNLPALVEAWRTSAKGQGVELVLAGRARADFPPLAPEPGLRVLGEVPDAELPALYSGALAFVYPSHYEGFGLPVLEAMQCGACVIASRAVAETAGDAALYAGDPAELAQAMRLIAGSAELRAERRALSLGRAREFTWDRTARLTRLAYEEAIKRFAA
jgi:glycosyltransferase involved in cell wall biosynthesis